MITMPANVNNAMLAGGLSKPSTKVGQSSSYEGKEGRNFYTRMRKPGSESHEQENESSSSKASSGRLDITA